MRHVLVTNDFPPKLGGIQSYLWELWRRLPADEVVVLTSPHPDAEAWDAEQPFRIVRTRQPVLLPEPWLRAEIRRLARETGAEAIVLDPALPLGLLGPTLGMPYAVVLHGAEVTFPARIPGSRQVLARVLRGAELVIAAGGYPLAEAERAVGRSLPSVVVPPGVDGSRFVPLSPAEREEVRAAYGISAESTVIVSVSRLVPRKGFDTLIHAVRELAHAGVDLVICGGGRDQARLERLSRGLPVHFVGRVPDADLPALYGSADVFAMLCRDRWAGLEQEGFGIVFLEAAATGVPSIAGRSGGSHEAVVDGTTGWIAGTQEEANRAVAEAVTEPAERHRRGQEARTRAIEEFDYDHLAARLAGALDGVRA